MRRLLIPTCLCLVSVGATTIGPQTPWPIEPIATSTHAKSKIKNKTKSRAKLGEKPPASAAPAPIATTKPESEPAVSLADRLAPFAAALRIPEEPRVKPPEIAAYAAATPSDRPPNPLAPASEIVIPMSPRPGTPASVRKRVVYRSEREICDTLAKAAQSNNLPVPFFIRLLFQESKFDAASVSHAGAQGIAQFMPETAADVGLDNPFDPLQAIPAAARLLRDFIDRFGNLGLAAAAYNAGPKRVQNWLTRRAALPAETRGYVKTITGQTAELWKAAQVGHGSSRLPQKAPCKDVSGLYAFNGTQRIPLPPQPAALPVSIAARSLERAKAIPEHAKVVALADASPAPGAKPPKHTKTALQLAARRRSKETRH